MNFAKLYYELTGEMQAMPSVNFKCRGLQMAKEMVGNAFVIDVSHGIEVFSHPTHRVIPIRFVLAELCYILAGRGDVASIASYNKSMGHYADDGVTMTGSYGLRLAGQLEVLVDRLCKDIYTRQACAAIFSREDCLETKRTHLPCNTFIQFLCRPPYLDLYVTSRSSDFVTGFSIDTLHWQALLILMANELRGLGFNVHPHRLYYNVASLHIYEADVSMVNMWDVLVRPQVPAQYIIPLDISLMEAIVRCKNWFAKEMTTMQLADILKVSDKGKHDVQVLDEMFAQYKNKLTR